MSVERTLARVEEDLNVGDAAMARTRLTSLVRSLPHRLDARERLADVCRLDGDLVEAGRWSYLAERRDEREMAAFERACGNDPVRIMRALRWRAAEQYATSDVARQRLLDVRGRAEAKAGRTLDWSDRGREVGDPWWHDAFAVGCLVTGVVLLALVVIGAGTVIGWIF
ncbi:DUF6584 family protein [Oerskovia sp. NPDC057915]|uniref:DUF6584 family protein n=1 Tax=Oerskovia sp. NPDC057915 TaxID=3346280 RepID=UPI0036DE58AA